MCGILAVIGNRSDGDAAEAALDLLEHRGPDGRGSWSDDDAWLGARRLAVIDIAGGDQPMRDPSGVVITYNGEVYNHVELRAELASRGHEFRTTCDTEVVLRAYLEWGEECVERFNGMWAFVVWDPRVRRAFFSRDRLGVKPLFYTLAGGLFSAASEPKALLALHPELRRVDERSLYELLALGRLYTGERTFYDGIAVVPAGCSGTVSADTPTPNVVRYWSPRNAGAPGSAGEELFPRVFEDSVRIRLRSDVPVGLTLSGGLDSTAILNAAATDPPSLTAFTSVFGADDELPWAKRAAKRYDVPLYEVPAADEPWLETLERVAWHLDGPVYSPAVIPLWHIMGAASQHGVKVMLEGQGGDEVLGGYVRHVALALLEELRRPRRLAHDARLAARLAGRRVLALWVARLLAPSLTPLYRRTLGSAGALRKEFVERQRLPSDYAGEHVRDLRTQLERDLTRDVLPGLLHYGDAISMGRSVEARQPFLDYRLVELALRMPADAKVAGGETKKPLRRYLRANGLEPFAERHDKRGFPTPLAAWIAKDAQAVRALLLGRDSRIGEYCSGPGLERLIERSKTGGGSEMLLFRYLSAEVWLRSCVA